MYRYKAIIEYDGLCFNGFQKQQSSKNTVQEIVENALLKLTSENVTLVGSGRTDSGVHAKGQVIHFDLSKQWPLYNLKQGLNFYLENVCVLSVEEVTSDFHARFSAKQRSYEYHILNRSAPPVLEQNRVWHVAQDLDIAKMQEAADLLIGLHNFKAFRSSQCQAERFERTIDAFDVERFNEKIICHIKARSFLHNQVRIMVGTIVWYALGKITLNDIQKALESGVKERIGPTAPPSGLYFGAVDF